MRSWINRRIRRKIFVKSLRVQKEESKESYSKAEKKYLREIRYMDEKIMVGSDLNLYDNKVAFISSQQENYGFIVESKEFSALFKNIFNSFWKFAGIKK